MAITTYLDIDQGSDFSAIFELQNDDGTAMDLTGITPYSQFRKSYNSTIGYTFVTSTISPETSGKIRISLPGATSSTIKPGRYLYDIELSGPENRKTRVVQGIITINPEITKIP